MSDAALATSPAARDELSQLRLVNRQLQEALESRIVIEQAKGILAERYGTDVEHAFALIRAAARANRVKLRELAAQIVASKETPTIVAVERRRRLA